VVNRLVEEEDTRVFYVGHQGQFDSYVWKVLRQIKEKHPHISSWKVLAYMPEKTAEKCEGSVLPEGIETVHPKYAIDWRNKWMIEQADIVVCYVTHPWGGAAKYTEMAKQKGKRILTVGNH